MSIIQIRVQAETQHWVKWMLDTYKYDGFRIDAASNITSSVLKQTADTVATQAPNAGGAGKLSYIESYSNGQTAYENKIGNPQLSYDPNLFYGLRSALGYAPSKRSKLSGLAKSGWVNRTNLSTSTASQPNWSFVSNHDQQKNIVNQIMLDQLGIKRGSTPSFEDQWSDAKQKAALSEFNNELQSSSKQYAPYNVPAQYAFMLTNLHTTPTIYYGDLYRTDGAYMAEKSPYYEPIMNIVRARKQLAVGNQRILSYKSNTSSTPGTDLIASVRSGNSRLNGSVTVIGSNPRLNTTLTVSLGASHANQKYRDASGMHGESLTTDGLGNLKVKVSGSTTASVNGYLGVWTPDSRVPLLANGGNLKLKFGAYAAIKADNNAKITQVKSSNSSVASVDKGGNIRALRNGTATITATLVASNGQATKYSAKVTSTGDGVILPVRKNYYVSGKHAASLKPVYSSAAVKRMSFKYSKKYLKVSSKGSVTAKRSGKAKVKATYTLANKHKVKVTVTYVIHKKAKLRLKSTKVRLKKGKSTTVKLSKKTVGTPTSRSYSKYSKKVISVSAKGKVTALKKGKTSLRVSTVMKDGQKATARMTVTVK